MKTFLRVAALYGLAMLASHAQAKAAVTYSYTGINFTNYFGIDNASSQPRIKASVTFASALGNNLSNANLTPEAWQISDGSLTLTNQSSNLTVNTQFIFSTDGGGNITAASVQVQQIWAQQINGNPGYNFLATNTSEDQTAYCYGSDLNSGCIPSYGEAYVIYGDATTTPQPTWTSEIVNSTTTSLTSSINPSTFGQSVTLTAKVTPSTATGTVTFNDGVATLGTANLSAGTATLLLSNLSVGSHSLTAVYGGDINDAASTSSVLTQTVLTASPQTITFGPLSNRTLGSGSFALNATASSGLTVTFGSNSTAVCTVSGVTVTLVAAGTCSITASQSGNSIYAAATPVTQTFTVAQTVTTTTSLTSSANPSIFGQSVTLTAAVMPFSATGSVTFRDGSSILNTVALSGGSAALGISSLVTGPHSLTATYGGDANDASSVSAMLTQQINQVVSSIGLTSSLNPSTFGTSLTLTARVSPSTATGTVSFLDGTTKLGNGTLSNGTAIFAISSLSVGAHSLTVVYGGDTNDAGSTSSVLTETVNQPTQTTTTTSLTSSANPAIFGQSLTLTATVKPSTATGTVTFNDGAASLGTANLSAGTATLALSTLTAGSHSLTAIYGGDSNDAASTSSILTQTVNQVVTVQPRVGGLLTCTLSTISGPYGYAISGLLAASGKLTPFADYGSFVANGSGTFVGASTESTGGTVASRSLSGSYSINGNCTGTATFTDSLGNVLHVAFSVVNNGNAILFIQTDSGTVISGEAQPAPAACDSSAVSGPYTYAIKGWTVGSAGIQPFADAGRIVADGNGNLTGNSTYSASGTIGRRTFTGTYSIGTACSGTATLNDSLGNTDTLAITVVNNGQQVLFIETDNGTTISGGSQRGQYACTTGSLTGPYSYALEGYDIASNGGIIPGADSGLFTSDGNGHFTGADTITVGGTIVARTVSGSYTVNADCTGSAVLTDTLGETVDLDLFVAAGGTQVQFTETDSGTVTSGSAQQTPAGTCTNAVLNGAYGYAIEGWAVGTSVTPYADSGQLTADGGGHLSSGSSTFSSDGTIISRTWSGTYQMNSNCSGSAVLLDNLGDTVNLYITASSDGRKVGFIETDNGSVISGGAQHQLAFPSDGIVSAASYAPGSVVPGSLFAIFGDGLSPETATAGALPWATQLGGTEVLVNGIAAPLYYASPTQINGQLPLGIQPGSAQLVVSDGLTSVPVAFNVPSAWPGIFTYGLLRAIAVNPDGSLNGPAAPARAGDILVVYLTGGGPVNPSGGAWMTGAASPPGLSNVTLPFTVTIGGLPASVDYLGLTPTEVGLYQLNVHVPTLPTGDQTLAVSIGGNISTSALISVAP